MDKNGSRLAAKSQADKFREAAREAETDEREDAFDRIVKKIAKAPAPKASREDKPDGGI